jgi:C4-type Zn-finger protein
MCDPDAMLCPRCHSDEITTVSGYLPFFDIVVECDECGWIGNDFYTVTASDLRTDAGEAKYDRMANEEEL